MPNQQLAYIDCILTEASRIAHAKVAPGDALAGIEMLPNILTEAIRTFMPDYEAPLTIDEVLDSLERRGFLKPGTVENLQTQVLATMEELGESARILRRHAQRGEPLDNLGSETPDAVIASICLAGTYWHRNAGWAIRKKMQADEKRGFQHANG